MTTDAPTNLVDAAAAALRGGGSQVVTSFDMGGLPRMFVVDNGPELTERQMISLADARGLLHAGPKS